jgi:hypothetical protein
LHIRRVDGHQADLAVADISDSIKMFEAIPWADEISQWEQVPEDQIEERRALFQVFDDSGHTLHITAYSEHLLGVAYNFPLPASPFEVDYLEEGYIGTDQVPREELRTLIECFYTSDSDAMLSLLATFPPTIHESPN